MKPPWILGCNRRQAFFKVVIPEIMPGIVSGFLMALTYSIDDFVISYFTSGHDLADASGGHLQHDKKTGHTDHLCAFYPAFRGRACRAYRLQSRGYAV